jgi:carbon monoxide dehydrogenase subunit G
MAVLHEVVETRLPLDQAFAFIADFSNSERWDPGTAWSKPLGDPTPAVGATYQLGVRMGSRVTPMEYRITKLEPHARVVLEGSGSNVRATDDIGFEATPSGTRIQYRANIRLTGWLRLIAPFAGGAFRKIARDAREGMKSTLDSMAEA